MSFFKPKHTNSSSASSNSSNTPFIGVQAKLNIGKSNDKYEKEADAVADKVVQTKGLFGNEPFFAPAPTIQRADEGEKDVQKSEETEQIQEKPIHDSITPLVQTKQEEEPVQKQEEEEAVQTKAEEEPVQMMEEEEAVQTKTEEEPIQKQEEEEAVQTKAEEEPVQMMEEEEAVQTKTEEEPIQKQEEEEAVQTKDEEEPVQRVEEEEAVQTKEEENDIQKKSEPEEALQTKEMNVSEPSPIQRKDEEIQEKEEEIQEKEGEEEIQRSSSVDTGDTSNLESNLASSKGGGSPMDSSTKDQMESGFGTDFSGVRIHNDSNAVQMNKELGAQAFTNGNDIYFNEGKYNPNTSEGQHLLAHELTHTVQQGASTQPAAQTKIQKAAAAPEPADAPATKPTTPLDISHKLNLTDAWSKYLDEQYASGKRKFEVDVKIGTRYSGTIELSKKRGTASGELAKYELTSGSKKNFLNINGWGFLQPLRDAGIDPVLVLNKFGDEQQTTGFLSVAVKGIAIGNAKGFITKLNENLDKMGFLGIEPIKITDGFENTFEQGRLIFQVGAMTTVVDGFLEAGGGMGITGDSFTFNVNAKVDVAGLASGELMLARGESGKLSGKLDIEAEIANVNAKLMVEYIEGAVTIQGSGKIQSEKFSGEITLLVTDKAKSKQMMNAALGVETMDAEKDKAGAPAAKPVPKTKNNQVLAGWGEVTANITPWLSGTAKVGIDSEGHVTIVGEITVPDDVELMEQRGKKVDLFKVEIRAGYGIPLVGQVFLFASIGMFMNAGFGPLLLKNVGFKGTYSTDPSVLQQFEITGTLNINAFAIIGLEAEAGVGVTILGHDIKAGVNVTAAAGLRAYAEATPTLEYKEQQSPQGGKVGESRLKGHFEAAAQLFMQLSGSLFYELDSPWWSPAPDGREDFPLGEVQYPIGDSMGIGADMDWLIGSPEIPELKFSPVEFDPDKFTADVMADPPPGKKGKSDENKPGKWEDKNKPGEQKDPPEKKDGKGIEGSDKKKEDLKKLPDQQKYMRSLDEMSKLEKADPKPTLEVVKAKAKKVKSKYGIDSITVKDKKEQAEIHVKHRKDNNKKNILKVPLMSAAERFKLLKKAMDDLKVRNKKAGGDEGKITQEDAKTLISTWKKAHPVIEEVRVVDGGKSWDYFIDIGDKSETEKGIPKKGEGPEFEEEFTTDEGENHEVWAERKKGKVIIMMASAIPDEVAKVLRAAEKIGASINDEKGTELLKHVAQARETLIQAKVQLEKDKPENDKSTEELEKKFAGQLNNMFSSAAKAKVAYFRLKSSFRAKPYSEFTDNNDAPKFAPDSNPTEGYTQSSESIWQKQHYMDFINTNLDPKFRITDATARSQLSNAYKHKFYSRVGGSSSQSYIFVEPISAQSEVSVDMLGDGVDTDLTKAVNSKGILKFMHELNNGQTFADGKITLQWFADTLKSHAKTRKWAADKFRGVKPGNHEWIPASKISKVLELAAADPIKRGENAYNWINLQNNLRSDTSMLVFKETKSSSTETVNDPIKGDQEYTILHGHTGALYYWPFNEDRKSRKQATKGTGEFHSLLMANFESDANPTVNDAIGDALDVVNSWIWESEALPSNIHPTQETSNGVKLIDNKSGFVTEQKKKYDAIVGHFNLMMRNYGTSTE